MRKHILESGLKLGAALVIFTLLLYVGDYLTSIWAGLLTFVIMIVSLIWFGLSYRKQNGGFISFKDVFITLTGIIVLAMFISTMFNVLLYHVIDPTLGESMNKEIINKTVDMMERYNVPQDEIDKAVDKIEEGGNKFTIPGLFEGMLYMNLFGIVLAAIIGAFVKKSPTPFETIDP